MHVDYDPQYVKDLQNLRAQCQNEQEYKDLIGWIEQEQKRIERRPIDHTAPCEYEPLASEGYRKNKFHSSLNRQGKADMRIIFQYIPEDDYIYYVAVGFRHTPRPHVYDRAEHRAVTKKIRTRLLFSQKKPVE